MMHTNVGKADRIMRIVFGLAVISLGMYVKNLWGLVGLEISLTGIFGWSPMYQLFHVSTDRHQIGY